MYLSPIVTNTNTTLHLELVSVLREQQVPVWEGRCQTQEFCNNEAVRKMWSLHHYTSRPGKQNRSFLESSTMPTAKTGYNDIKLASNCVTTHYSMFSAQTTSVCFLIFTCPYIQGRLWVPSLLSPSPADTSHDDMLALSEAIIHFLLGPLSFLDNTAVIH